MVYNRECAYCGSKYYACNNCVKKNSWKTICCCRECYQKLAKENEKMVQKIIGVNAMNTLMRIVLNSGIVVDIVGYDLEMGRFDAKDGTTYKFEDIKNFTISSDEMKEISDRLASKIGTQ